LSGPIAAGKTELAEGLAERFGFLHVSTSTLLPARLGATCPVDRAQLQREGNDLDQETRGRWVVWLIAATEARDVGGAVTQCVETMLEQGLEKFAEKRWGELHVLTFHKQEALMTAERVQAVMTEFDADDLANLNMVLLVQDDSVSQVWPPEDVDFRQQ